jgi:precorrin-6A/cobalt-precorrin-6A reductase
VLRRPGWESVPGDRWQWVDSLPEAAAALDREQVFLTIGRQGVASFASCDSQWFLIRCVEPPAPPLPARHEVLLDRGPFTVDGERTLLRRHEIGVLVTKDSGGPMTAPS